MHGPGAYVMKVETSNFFVGCAHTLVYVADITVGRTKTNEKGLAWAAINFQHTMLTQCPTAMASREDLRLRSRIGMMRLPLGSA